ncbi:MAG: WecB/TagA/CpsF family glycosyltransferase [Clostridia bacterium]|nr:WecB/TagA/CpsF family glycosyltransferase [Clostridia bacterium]
MNGIHPLLLSEATPETAAHRLLSQTKGGSFIVTLNLELLTRALSSPDFAHLMKKADEIVCDGIGAKCLLKIGHPHTKIPRIPGIDLGYAILKLAESRGLSIFLLGGKEGVAEEAAHRLQKGLPNLSIAGTAHGYFSKVDLPALRGRIRTSGAEIVFVCLGSPLQEEWILQNRRYLPNVRLFLPLGGSLDVFAGAVRRAPHLWQSMGLEWAWRIAHEPHRIGRLWQTGVNLCSISPEKWKFFP